MKYPILTKQFLYQKYIVEKLSTYQIAKIIDCGIATIWKYLKKYNIPTRTISESHKGALNPMYGKHLSEETRRKMSEAKKGENSPNYGKFGKESSHWKGGRKKDSNGYWHIYNPNHPYADKNGYVYEHRLVVEQYLGRYLLTNEVVHHINGIKDDNRIENLMVFCCDPAHRRWHKNPNNVKPEEIIFDGRKLSKEGDMTLKDYQKHCKETWISNTFDKIRTILGICGEAGEIAEAVKKYDRGDYSYKEFLWNLEKELGDILYYIVMSAYEFDLDLDDIIKKNISKLQSRKARGKIKGSGNER